MMAETSVPVLHPGPNPAFARCPPLGPVFLLCSSLGSPTTTRNPGAFVLVLDGEYPAALCWSTGFLEVAAPEFPCRIGLVS